jgi:hypothetical protein
LWPIFRGILRSLKLLQRSLTWVLSRRGDEQKLEAYCW